MNNQTSFNPADRSSTVWGAMFARSGNAADRLRDMAQQAIDQYNAELSGGGEPTYPAWAQDVFDLLDSKKPIDHTDMRARLADSLAALWQCPQSEYLARANAVIEAASRAMLPVTDSDVIEKSASAIESYGNSELAAKLRSIATPVAGWVSVEERLPEHAEEDAAYVWASWAGAPGYPHEPRQGLARYIKALGWQPQGCQGWDWIVTHWHPLPVPPAPVTPKQEQSNG